MLQVCENPEFLDKAEKIKKVKDFLLFQTIYEMTIEKDEDKHFNSAYEKTKKFGKLLKQNTNFDQFYEENKEIFDKLKEKLRNNEEESDKFFDILMNYYGITDDNIYDELTILFKINIYEQDINSIIFFFEFFEIDNKEWNSKLSKDYKNITEKEFKEIKSILKELKK